MTTEQTILIKNSWKKIRNVNALIIGDLFYTKLFFDHPRLRKMFPAEMEQQNKKLVDMLSYIVSNMDNFKALEKNIQALAARHQEYGAKPGHYRMIGSALMWTLEKAISEEWNVKLQEAWISCYAAISQIMIAATVEKVV